MIDDIASAQALELITLLRALKRKVVTIESLTGGLISATLTSIAGASEVVARGYVVYTNEAKEDLLYPGSRVVKDFGPVSRETAVTLAEAVLEGEHTGFPDMTVMVTGLAGPGGADGLPAGRVHIAVAYYNRQGRFSILHEQKDYGPIGRGECRLATVKDAMRMMLEAAQDMPGKA